MYQSIILTPEEIQYQLSHWGDDEAKAIIITTSVFFIAALISVVLRFISRRVQHVAWHADDYMMLIALFQEADMVKVVRHHFGMHSIRVGIPNAVVALQLLFSLQILYNAAHFSIKASILLLYRQIFTLHNPQFRIAWYCAFVYALLCVVCGIITVVVQCLPSSYGWEAINGGNGKCANLIAAKIGNGATLAVADLIILILPMRSLWSIHIATKQKLQICGLFALGLIAVTSSFIRISRLAQVRSTLDFTYTGVVPLIWSLIEVDLGIICGCGPTLRPLFIGKSRLGSKKSTSGNSQSVPGDSNKGLNVSWPRGPKHVSYRNADEDESLFGSPAPLEMNPIVERPTDMGFHFDTSPGVHSYMAEDDDTPMRTEDSSSSGSGSDSESEAEVEWLVAGREKRSTAGNRLTSLLQQEEPDDELELLFAEAEDDAIFEDVESESDAQMDSSDDDDQGPAAGADDLEGEKEIQRQDKAERQAKRRKLNDGIPKMYKKVEIDPTANQALAPRPKKKSERASWIPTAEELPTRASARGTTKQQKKVLLVQLQERENLRIQVAKKSAAKKVPDLPKMTHEERLAQAAKIEKANAKSLSRWEEAEQQREEEQRAKLAALSNRQLQGPVITWWSGLGEWVGGKLRQVGKALTLEEPKEKLKKRKASEMEDSEVGPSASPMPSVVSASEVYINDAPSTALLPPNPPTNHPLPTGVLRPPAHLINLPNGPFNTPLNPGSLQPPAHLANAAPHPPYNPPATLDGSAPLPGFTAIAPHLPSQPPLSAPQPPPQPPVIEHSTLNYIILQNFDETAIKNKDVQTQILMNQKFAKVTKPKTECCAITTYPAKYRDPSTGLPYANSYAYKEIQRLKKGQYRWSSLLGAYMGQGAYAATGVPPRFLDAVSKSESSAMMESTMKNKAQHLDQDGNVFELPNFTMKQIHDAIPPHCFKPSILRSMAYVVRDYFYLSTLVYLAVTYIPLLPNVYLRFAAWTAYTILQGFVFTGIWILAHECGHGAFSKSKKLNWTMGLIMHSFLLVPFHSWRLSHSQHHKATGNIERDTAFVPDLREGWLQRKMGPKAQANMVEFAELAEDSPIACLWHDIVHQVFGWPGYLLFNLTGQDYNGARGAKISHFYFGEDSVFYKKNELALIMLSDFAVIVMIAALVVAGQMFGSWNVIVLWGVPWLMVNNWIVAITFLQHTDASMPHYNNSTWTFARGATATIDRDLGFIDTHLFHDIIGTHVCHHLVSTIPFYHAGEASIAIKRVMGVHYKADVKTPFWTAFWRNQRNCKFIEESEGMEGSGIFFFRNLYKKNGQMPAKDLTNGIAEKKVDKKEDRHSAMATAMSSSRNLDARRRLSQSAQLRANLPLLAE